MLISFISMKLSPYQVYIDLKIIFKCLQDFWWYVFLDTIICILTCENLFTLFFAMNSILYCDFHFMKETFKKHINSGNLALVRAFELLATIRNWFFVKTYDEQHICLEICERWYHCTHGHSGT